MNRPTLSSYEKELIQNKDDEKVFKRDMREILIASARSYHTIDDGLLSAYLNGAVYLFKRLQISRVLAAGDDGSFERYTRETRRCNEAICRIQRERLRRMYARIDGKSRE